ncbi:MAG: cardiolipin synthase ClsB [Leptothrix sp. (in: b-proteobacteria)]
MAAGDARTDRHGAHPWAAFLIPRPDFLGGHRLQLLRGGDALFPAMVAAIDAAHTEVWLASYIFHDDASAAAVAEALLRAAARGVAVRVVVDGFGSHHSGTALLQRLTDGGVALAVFRPLQRWGQWLQPGQLRRLHMKLCVVDARIGFIGGVNLIDDRIDLNHGPTDQPRFDFAVQAVGPVVLAMTQAVRAMWSRAWLGHDWRAQALALLRTGQPLRELRALWRQWRMPRPLQAVGHDAQAIAAMAPMVAALVVRDNLRQRRTIERAHIDAMQRARQRIWLITPYFYPGSDFRHALREAAARGVEVRLILQGKVDYRLAALAARVLYAELLDHGVHIHEYMPAFLHAKAMLVDEHWATVGSSNIDPLSLLLNLEANLIVQDAGFSRALAAEIGVALAQAREVPALSMRGEFGATRFARRAAVAWCAHVYLRLAGVSGRY